MTDSSLFPIFVALAGGGIAGLAAGLWAGRTRAKASAAAQSAAMEERLQNRDQEVKRFQEQMQEARLLEQQLRTEATAFQVKQAELQTSLDEERKRLQEKVATFQEAEARLTQSFKALSAEALNRSQESFLHLAKATLDKYQEGAKADLDKRSQSFQELVKPVRESLEKVDTKIHELEKVRVSAYDQLKTQLGSLLSETARLTNALHRPSVRGQWGELQLRRVVEIAGMLNYCDFQEQASVSTEEGRLRPDLLVRLPGGKTLAVDAKAPLEAYLQATDLVDERQRAEKMKDHARQIRAHIALLSKKAYWQEFEHSPEFVVLFLPGEIFFSAALEQDPSLIEIGVDQKVLLATPTTLIALLKAVAYGWRQETLAENARLISELGQEMHKRLATMADHFGKLGESLNRSVDSYNQAMRSLESRVLVSARKFRELGAGVKEIEIKELSALDQVARPPEIEASSEGV